LKILSYCDAALLGAYMHKTDRNHLLHSGLKCSTALQGLLMAACHSDGRAWCDLRHFYAAAAPLEALRVSRLQQSVYCFTAFSGTLRHSVLPNLPWYTAVVLSDEIIGLKALQARTCFLSTALVLPCHASVSKHSEQCSLRILFEDAHTAPFW